MKVKMKDSGISDYIPFGKQMYDTTASLGRKAYRVKLQNDISNTSDNIKTLEKRLDHEKGKLDKLLKQLTQWATPKKRSPAGSPKRRIQFSPFRR